MARIGGVSDDEAGIMTRMAFAGARRMLGKIPEPMRIMARSPWTMRANAGFELAMRRAKRLDPRLKDLASIKVSSLVECLF